MKLNSTWLAAGIIGANNLVQHYKKSLTELFTVQSATVYLKGVEIVRHLFLVQVSIMACLVFVIFGVILIEAAVIFYMATNSDARTLTMILVGAVDILVAGSVLAYFASSNYWLQQAAKYNATLEELIKN